MRLVLGMHPHRFLNPRVIFTIAWVFNTGMLMNASISSSNKSGISILTCFLFNWKSTFLNGNLERFTNLFGAVTVDEIQCYELIKLEASTQDIYTAEEVEFLSQQKYLKMRNPSTGEYHIEGVHPNCQTVREALAWRNGTEVEPSIIT